MTPRIARSRYGPLALGLLVFLAACMPPGARHVESQPVPSPCDDPVYVELAALPPDSLSEREWSRLQELERRCRDALRYDRPYDHHDGYDLHGLHWWTMGAMMLVMGIAHVID